MLKKLQMHLCLYNVGEQPDKMLGYRESINIGQRPIHYVQKGDKTIVTMCRRQSSYPIAQYDTIIPWSKATYS